MERINYHLIIVEKERRYTIYTHVKANTASVDESQFQWRIYRQKKICLNDDEENVDNDENPDIFGVE